MTKEIPIRHLQKIKSKIKKAIFEQNSDILKKWCHIIYKNNLEKTFIPYFQNAAILLINETNNFNEDFFNCFVSESGVFSYCPERLIRKSVICLNKKSYQILKKQENFYQSTFFDKTCFKTYYTHSFEEDFLKVLKLAELKDIEKYASNLHLNSSKNINLTRQIFQILDPEKRKSYYLENLFQIVNHEKNEVIKDFFNLVIIEIHVDVIESYFLQQNKTNSSDDWLFSNNLKKPIGYALFNDLVSSHKLKLKLEQELFAPKTDEIKFKKIKI